MKEDFKIIAIRPLEKCDSNYSKVLKKGQVYTFYNEYEIDTEKDIITFTESVPSELNDVNNIKVNISAIVGKNGEGKSTLVELLFMAINNITYKGIDRIDTVDIKLIKNLAVDIYFKDDMIYKFHIDSCENNEITIEISEYKNFNETPLNKSFDKFDFNRFFYTIGTNYSHYALNSRDFGPWIHNIFHKNDAYQAPIVVNPIRKEGIIDINNEEHLLMSRLMSVVLSRHSNNRSLNRQLTEKQIANKVSFSILTHKVESSPRYNSITSSIELDDGENILNKISTNEYKKAIKEIGILFNYRPYEFKTKKISFAQVALEPTVFTLQKDIHEYVEKYIVKKVFSIALKYQKYNKHINASESTIQKVKQLKLENTSKYISNLFNDKSHITLKLRQAINFIKYDIIKFFNDSNLKEGKYELSIRTLSNEIYKISRKQKIDMVELIPPAIFKYDIILVDTKTKKNPTSFNKLSSGEKQLIYCVSSVMYHLSNLNSVLVKSDLIKYRRINLIFEEIELYFHPDLQRQFIHYLLDTLKNQRFRKINGINIIFVTHSPFILSDIPSQNIVFLKVNKEDNLSYPQSTTMATFGGNIHDILKNSFFLENGSMGERAGIIINQTIDFLRLKYLESEIGNNTSKEKSLVWEDEYKKLKEKVKNLNFDYHYKVINLIDEPILKAKLREMYQNVCNDDDKLKLIRQQIEELQQIEKELTEN